MEFPSIAVLAIACLASSCDSWSKARPVGKRESIADPACTGTRSRNIRFEVWKWDSQSQVAELNPQGELRHSPVVIGDFHKAWDHLTGTIQVPSEEYERLRKWLIDYQPESSVPVMDGSLVNLIWCDDTLGHAFRRRFPSLDAHAPRAQAVVYHWWQKLPEAWDPSDSSSIDTTAQHP